MIKEYRVSMQKNYFCLCLSQVQKYESISAKIHGLESSAVSEDELHIVEMNLSVLYEEREQVVLAPIVFAAMCLEAFIYDYGASHFGDSYMKKHLDKIDLASKFVLATRLATEKEFPIEGQAYQGLVDLIKDRNSLVHFKSRKFEIAELHKASEYRESLNQKHEKAMYSAIKTVREIMKELDKIHGNRGTYEYSIEPTQCHA